MIPSNDFIFTSIHNRNHHQNRRMAKNKKTKLEAIVEDARRRLSSVLNANISYESTDPALANTQTACTILEHNALYLPPICSHIIYLIEGTTTIINNYLIIIQYNYPNLFISKRMPSNNH
jgi:hypothetical protein